MIKVNQHVKHGACSIHGRDEKDIQTLWMKNTKVGNNFEDLGIYRKIIFIQGKWVWNIYFAVRSECSLTLVP
jgi:hypothetical protein